MSKEQHLSPPPSPPVKSSSKLPPLPNDFLSFQPQPSFNIHDRSEDVDNNVADNTNSLDNKQEQQQGSGYQQYYGEYNLAGGDGGGGYNDQYDGSYGTPGTLKSGHNSGGWNNYTTRVNNYANNYTPRVNNYTNNYKRRGNNYANNYTPRGNNYANNYTPRVNNYSQAKKQRFNDNRFNDTRNRSDDVRLYYKKSFLDDPWADLFDKELLKNQKPNV